MQACTNTHTQWGGFDDCYVNLIKIKERNNLIQMQKLKIKQLTTNKYAK